MIHVAKHIGNVFRAKIVEKKEKDVNTEKTESQIFLDVGFRRTKNSQLLGIKQQFSDESGQWN